VRIRNRDTNPFRILSSSSVGTYSAPVETIDVARPEAATHLAWESASTSSEALLSVASEPEQAVYDIVTSGHNIVTFGIR
jgi:hypothetical protein